jgi:hypothetical protein
MHKAESYDTDLNPDNEMIAPTFLTKHYSTDVEKKSKYKCLKISILLRLFFKFYYWKLGQSSMHEN